MKNVARIGAALAALACVTALQAGTTAGATDLTPPATVPTATSARGPLETPGAARAACSQERPPASGRLAQVDCARCQAFWGKTLCCVLINKRCCNYTPPPSPLPSSSPSPAAPRGVRR